jgi:hypothetical protein
LHSGVSNTSRAKAGVGCLIHKDCVNKNTHWNFINEILMTVNIKVGWKKEYTLITACGPNKDENVEIKDTFLEELKKVTDKATGEIIILGDLNGRVGNESEEVENVNGRYEEKLLMTMEGDS